jgi:D-beta-D-heptose 7-phosphate kinase/D-beta-D-heptose 1-phosphate adenosyltransferase
MKGLPELLKKISQRRLLVIGDVMLDHYQWGDVTRISPEAPVPVVNIINETDTVGGAANVANNVAALGAAVEVVGAVGQDANGDRLQAHLRKNNISFDDHFIFKGTKTITKTRVIVRNQQLCRLDYEDAPGVYRNKVLNAGNLKRIEDKIGLVDGVILSDYAKGMLTTEVIGRLTAMVRKSGKFIALDPKPSSGNQYEDLDLLTPNRKEAIELSGLQFASDEDVDYKKVCASIWSKFKPRNLVITLGSQGMLISTHGKVAATIPTAARQVYDVSGAGDTVIAALALALTSGASLEQAAHFANAAAGVVVGKLGTATVTPRELLAYANAAAD